MTDSQKARDYADQKQFQADIINYSEHKHYSIAGKQADEYLLELFENNFPRLHSEAMKVATQCAKDMGMEVVAGVSAIDPALITNFRRPNVQAALLSAQQSFAETGDPDTGSGDVALGRVLAKLVVKLVSDPTRGPNEILIRRAIELAPNLTTEQINSLSVIAILDTCTFKGATADELLDSIDDFFSSYYGQVPVNGIEYSYMEAAGVGSSLYGVAIFADLCNKHRKALRKSFAASAMPAEVDDSDKSTYLENDPSNPELLRVRAEKLDELLGKPRTVGSLEWAMEGAKSVRALRQFVAGQFLTPDDLSHLAEKQRPELHAFLKGLDDAGAAHMQLNTIGYILAKQELDLRFPSNELLESMVSVAPSIQKTAE